MRGSSEQEGVSRGVPCAGCSGGDDRHGSLTLMGMLGKLHWYRWRQ
jgi:hypothetical protein